MLGSPHFILFYFLISIYFFFSARSWSVVSWNAGGFNVRIKDVGLRTDITKHDVILVQETQCLKTPFLALHDVWAIPAIPNPNGGRPSGGLAIFVSKNLPYSWDHVYTDQSKVQACILRFEKEECLLVNVYVPPKLSYAFDVLFSPLADVLKRYSSIASHLVAGDFNARIGDANLVDPEDEFLPLLPSLNLDRSTNENRAGFLSFLDTTDLRMLNGFNPLPTNPPNPATFTFTSIRALPPPAPKDTRVVARSCIDYILASPSLLPLLSPLRLSSFHNSEHCTLSTHVPYLNDLHPRPSPQPIQKFCPPDLAATLTIFRSFDLCIVPPTVHPITYLINQIHAQGQWKPRPPSKSWFETPDTVQHSCTVSRLRSNARRHYRALVEKGELHTFSEFMAARSDWIRAVDEGRKLASTSFQNKLAAWKQAPHLPGHSSKLWKIMSGKRSEFGTAIPESDLIAHFNSLLYQNQPLQFHPTPTPTHDPFLDDPFTADEVRTVITSKSSNSAPGADQLQYSFWKEVAADPESLSCLTTLFNHVFSTGKVPEDWHTAIVTMLYKGKGARNLATNFRAISLTSTSLKIFESLLANCISTWAETNNLFTFHQAGFRKNYSTYDHIFSLATVQQQAKKKTSVGFNNIYVGFVDLAKAFPSVSHSKLLCKLQKLGLSSKVLNVIADMYTTDSYRFILSQANLGSQSGLADTGTREGSCLSPLLFLLFVQDLPAFLNECNSLGPKVGNVVLRVMQFADDTTLLAIGCKKFQILLNRFALYCAENELSINASKTEVINLRPRARASRKDHWTLNSQLIRISSSARFLGVIFSTGRLGIHHARHLRSRNLAKVWSLVGRIRHAGFVDASFISRLFSVLITSSATYGAGLLLPFSIHHLHKNLDCLLTNFHRATWSLPRGTPNHLVLQLANSPCMTCICVEDAIRFLLRKFRHWGDNSPLIEACITTMFEDRGSLEDPESGSWLGFLTRYLQSALHLPLPLTSLAELKTYLLTLNPGHLHRLVTRHCHASCYPPSPTRTADYLALDVASASYWPCFQTAAPPFKLCRFFVSDSFRHSRLLFQNGIERECKSCGVQLSIRHWLHCPLRSADRALLSQETGYPVNSLMCLCNILRDSRHSVAFEFVLSRFFKWN